MRPLRALLVDVGGTLVNDATMVSSDRYRRARLRQMADALGARHAWFDAFVDHTFEPGGAEPHEQRTAEVVTTFLLEHGVTPTEDEVAAICRANVVPYPEVAELEEHALDAMRAARRLGLRMAICSNTLWRNDDDCRRDWHGLGFGDLFDGYVSSHSTGFEKPHPAMFERCLALLDARPDEAAIVGDRPERDLAGARAVGMRAIWKRPYDFAGPPDPTPDAEISCLLDLLPILEEWSSP